MDLLKFNSNVTRILSYNNLSQKNLKQQILKNNYDVIIDLQNNLRTRSLLSGTNSEIVRFKKRSFSKFLLVNFKINRLRNAPPIPVRYACVVDQLQLDNNGLEIISEKNSSVIPDPTKKYIGFAPGARHFTKRWPKEYFAELGHLLKRDGFTIILLGGKEDKLLCEELSKAIEGSLNLCSENDILQIVADMKLCSAVVCNDSGLMHTACAAGVPVLAIFGSTVREFGFTPYKSRSLILENKLLSCRPCSHIGRSRCPKGHFRCMLDVTPEEASKKLMDLLS